MCACGVGVCTRCGCVCVCVCVAGVNVCVCVWYGGCVCVCALARQGMQRKMERMCVRACACVRFVCVCACMCVCVCCVYVLCIMLSFHGLNLYLLRLSACTFTDTRQDGEPSSDLNLKPDSSPSIARQEKRRSSDEVRSYSLSVSVCLLCCDKLCGVRCLHSVMDVRKKKKTILSHRLLLKFRKFASV